VSSQRQFTQIPSRPGTYALKLLLSTAAEISVGKLGRFTFPVGTLIYVGSALGPGGLAGRLKNHIAAATAPRSRARWHIDYLHDYAKLVEIWYIQQTIRREHDWAALLNSMPGSSIPVSHFGSSDCRCLAHLFHFSHRPGGDEFRRVLEKYYPEDDLAVMNLSQGTLPV
jgi:Uri superfamily endonuclease